MKQFIAAISLAAYLVFSCGVVISSHYCMNKLTARHLFNFDSNTCERCGMDINTSNGCCSDELTVIKQYQDQQPLTIDAYNIPAPESFTDIHSAFLNASIYNAGFINLSHVHSPPLLSKSDTYLEIEVFRI